MGTSINFNTILGNHGGTCIMLLPSCSDADAAAFLISTGIRNSIITDAICTLVTELKTANLWNKLEAIYPFVGGTATTHKYNLKNPLDDDAGYRLIFNGGIVHSSTGAQPNGVNGYANTFVNSSITNFPIPDYISFGYYSRTPGSHTTGGNVIGSFGNPSSQTTSTRLLIRYIGNPNTTFSGINYPDGVRPNAITTTDNDGSGYYIGTRSSTASKLFIRGILRATNSAGGNSTWDPPAYNMYLFAYNNKDIFAANFTNKECAFAHIGIGLTDADCSTLTSIVDNFQMALGRNV